MKPQQGTAMFLPAWNEADNLPSVIAEAVVYLRSRDEPFTVIVVDDGSTDHTAETVGQLMQAYPGCIHFVQHERNMGYGAALRTGFLEGLKTEHEWIGFCDADGQFRPQDIGKLIDKAVESQSDIAIGFRVERADSLKRRIMGRAWHELSRFVLGYDAIDVDCGIKVFRRHAMEHLYPQLCGDHAVISPEILARAHRAGHRITEMGIDHFPRRHGAQSGSSLNVIWASLVGLIVLRQQINQTSTLKRRIA